MGAKSRKAPAQPGEQSAATQATNQPAGPANSDQIAAMQAAGPGEEVDPLAELAALGDLDIGPDEGEELQEQAMSADSRRMWDSR